MIQNLGQCVNHIFSFLHFQCFDIWDLLTLEGLFSLHQPVLGGESLGAAHRHTSYVQTTPPLPTPPPPSVPHTWQLSPDLGTQGRDQATRSFLRKMLVPAPSLCLSTLVLSGGPHGVPLPREGSEVSSGLTPPHISY